MAENHSQQAGATSLSSMATLKMNPNNKKPYGCSEEPDVQVIVGSKTFYEYRQILCSVSDYFDAALMRSDGRWKESSTKVFEFPDRNPDEWELLMQILAPASRTRLPEDQLMTIFQWADELCISYLPLQCDDLLAQKVLGQLYEYDIDPTTKKATKLAKSDYHAKLIDACELSIRFHLQRSFNGLFAILSQAMNSEPHEFQLESIQQVLSWMSDGEIRGLLLPFLDQHLPNSVRDKFDTTEELLANPLFPHLLYCHMQRAGKEEQQNTKKCLRDNQKKKNRTWLEDIL